MRNGCKIKEENCGFSSKERDENEALIKCTCKGRAHDSKHGSQVLVNFGLSRKKVFTVNEKVKLIDIFTSYVKNEPAFRSLLEDSYVVFQEYSEKFHTWVDVDRNYFMDGTVLNAVFFPNRIECDDSNPGSIRKCLETGKKSKYDGVVVIDLSEVDVDIDKNPETNCNRIGREFVENVQTSSKSNSLQAKQPTSNDGKDIKNKEVCQSQIQSERKRKFEGLTQKPKKYLAKNGTASKGNKKEQEWNYKKSQNYKSRY